MSAPPTTLSEMTLDDLKPRHRELALLVADGLTNVAIAHRMCLAESTVKNHLGDLHQQMGLNSYGDYMMRVVLARWVWEQQRGQM